MTSWHGIRTLRWVMVGFGAIAGVVLLTAGATLFGAVLLTFAILRLVMLLAMQRRMRQWDGAGRGSGAAAGVGNPNRDTMQRLARGELVVAASAIGITPDDLRHAVDEGRSIAAVAADAGVPTRQVVDAVVRDATSRVEHAVAAGNLASNRAERLRTRLPRWADRFVHTTHDVLGSGAPPTRGSTATR